MKIQPLLFYKGTIWKYSNVLDLFFACALLTEACILEKFQHSDVYAHFSRFCVNDRPSFSTIYFDGTSAEGGLENQTRHNLHICTYFV